MSRLLVLSILASGLASSCSPAKPHPYDESLGSTDLTIQGQKFRLWVADDDRERIRGLMFVKEEEIAPFPDGTERGMIFLFGHDSRTSFWMKNTLVPLDIAYLDEKGEVISVYTMAPLDERHNRYLPARAFRVAIEVRGGVFRKMGLQPGDRIEIPAALLNRGS